MIRNDSFSEMSTMSVSSDGTNNLGVTIGTVLGTCAVILIVIGLLLVAYTRRKRKLDRNK